MPSQEIISDIRKSLNIHTAFLNRYEFVANEVHCLNTVFIMSQKDSQILMCLFIAKSIMVLADEKANEMYHNYLQCKNTSEI